MSKNPAMVVLSGGQDSTICAFWAKREFGTVHAVTVDYGQKHSREIDAARMVADLAGVDSHETVAIGPVLAGRSPLTNPAETLETYRDFTEMDRTIGNRVELTFVPMRNPMLLTVAANRAVCRDTFDLVTGVCEADNANYPDCRRRFIDAFESMTARAMGVDRFEVHTPLMTMSKAQSIALALELPGCYAALAHSHTAYSGEFPPVTQDHATVLRAEGFREAGIPDPLIVRAHLLGLCVLPTTPNYDGVRASGVSDIAELAELVGAA